MRFLLDTDHCSYLQRRHPAVTAHFQNLPAGSEVVTSVVTQAELLIGIRLTSSERRREELRCFYRSLLADISDILMVTPEAAEQFAEVLTRLRRRGKPIPVNDVWIAAIALAHGLVLVTHDEHFQQIDGLTVEDWSAEGR